jgi:hypothetical protein
MMENINKPVVLTSDPIDDELLAIVGSLKSPDVVIISNGSIIRATRSMPTGETSITSIDRMFEPSEEPSGGEHPKVTFMDPEKTVTVVKSSQHPTTDPDIDGVIIIVDDNNPKLLQYVKDLTKKGVIVAHISDPKESAKLESLGSINVTGMTPSSAYSKLLFIISNVQERELIPELMKLNMRGEYGKYISDA